MFSLTLVKDRVRIEPANFDKSTDCALADEINAKYANRIIPNIGLCICLFDIVERSEGYVYHSDGCSYVNVLVRLVIFCPFQGEVLVGRIRSCSPQGVHVTMGFFDDILIPANMLREGSEFDVNEQLWVWIWEGNELYMDIDEKIRFRVVDGIFSDVKAAASQRQRNLPNSEEPVDAVLSTTKTPHYSIIGSIQDSGLGLVTWWGGS